ncbi:hypothetical protein ACT9SR_13405, partial [Enterococcus faecalis]|uniref:hypothetical protein n=1 Tax=Enterococcus faecalis TaxID=1351 RepID=UPI00403A28BC
LNKVYFYCCSWAFEKKDFSPFFKESLSLVVVKKAKRPSLVERTMKELFQRWELQFHTQKTLKKATLALVSLLR